MNAYLQSVLLGIVEGLTEFLPVSSTAHLRISEALMRIGLNNSACPAGNAACLGDVAYWKMYTIVIQLGAILALLLLFLGRIVDFLRTFPQGEGGERNWLTHPLSLILIAFACTSAPALLLRKWSERNLGSLEAMSLALVIGGVVMWIVDARSERFEPVTRHIEEMSLWQAVWIGLWQALSAIFPGTSRSMSTIAAGQLAGMDRPSALEFSFLLSLPTMIAATGWELIGEIHSRGGEAAHVAMNGERWMVLLIGAAVSFIVALGVVEWFLYWVRKHGFAIFALYRILLGAALLIWGARIVGS
ncbi:MAG: undecaprenyl-diphosphate phosphatase [Terracidiphilus sp.]